MGERIALALALLVAGCAATRPISALDVDPLGGNYEQIVREYVGRSLFDPYSAVYQIAVPRPARSRGARGWGVCGTVNAKNRMGGYVGATPFFALIRGGQIVDFEMGPPPSGYGNLQGMFYTARCAPLYGRE